MQDKANQPALLLFAKAPVPGRVKTRLMPALNAKQAAEVATVLIEHTVKLALENWPGPVTLHTWPDPDHSVFRYLSAAHGLDLAQQSQGDLGEKMHNAIAGLTQRGIPGAIMGCDVPHCPGKLLQQACALLRGGHNIIGPTTDGGYYLIGLQHAQPALFEHVQWGSTSVLQTTLDTAQSCGVAFTFLPTLRDVDRFEDLKWAAETVPDLEKWAT